MNLLKSTGIIGGLTLVSRVAGFAREMIFARVLGAGAVSDAFLQAFLLPNTFRRLFAEGAFSAAFVPMFSKRLHQGEGIEDARRFSNDVLSVFLPVLIALAAIFEIAMPGVIWLLASDWQEIPGKFELGVALARITFPYIVLISLVTVFSAMLNSVSRFAPGASFPIILNIVMIAALLFGDALRRRGYDTADIAYVLAWAVMLAGFLQLGWVYLFARRAGFRPRLGPPRITPEVKRLGLIAFPAALGTGAYQISQLVQVYFLNQLESGSLSHVNYADRLNQLPLGIIGIALGTAILPSLSKFVGAEDRAGADRMQSNAIELAMLLTIPAAAALALCALPFVTLVFLGGRFEPEDAAITADVLTALVAGLPAYVLIKVLVPSFYARADTKTPVYAALAALAFFVLFNLFFLFRFGVVGVAAASAAGAWINCAILLAILSARDLYRPPARLIGRIGRQIAAAAMMAAALYAVREQLWGLYAGDILARAAALAALVAAGTLSYFAAAFALGAVDRQRLRLLMTRKAAQR
ncbi:MAG: murein biosynthesis integral membrane protein MurJ [Sphingomonadaceae bacterium]